MAHSRSRTSQPQPLTPQRITQYSVKAVRSEFVPYYWDFVRKYIQDALKHCCGELNADDIYNYLCAERMYLFVAMDEDRRVHGASVCEVVQYTRKKAIRVVTLSGEDFEQWRPLMQNELEDWREKIRADYIEAYVRPGFRPQLEKIGYKPVYIGMVYDAVKALN